MSAELLPQPLPDRLLTDAEVAEFLNVPASWVGEAARAGRLPHVMLGRYRRFDPADLRECLEELKRGGRRRDYSGR
jgi:excisionase family DNA binding protein